MKTVIERYFTSLPLGGRVLVLCYALGYPMALLGQVTHTIDLYEWLGLWPSLVRKGEVWCVLTYAFLPNGLIDWVISLFWLATLVSIMGRNWTGRELWTYCVLATVVGAGIVVIGEPRRMSGVVGNPAMIFGLLAAWYRLYGRERLVLLGVGEISVRQAVGLVTLIEVLITWYGLGWFVTLAMMGGGAASWLFLVVRGKQAMNRRSQVMDSQRIARLEL